MTRRAYFKNNRVAYLLVAPQLLIIFVFFYWPTGEALFWAFTLEQPWGGGNEWVGLDNLRAVLSDGDHSTVSRLERRVYDIPHGRRNTDSPISNDPRDALRDAVTDELLSRTGPGDRDDGPVRGVC